MLSFLVRKKRIKKPGMSLPHCITGQLLSHKVDFTILIRFGTNDVVISDDPILLVIIFLMTNKFWYLKTLLVPCHFNLHLDSIFAELLLGFSAPLKQN